MKNVQSNNEKLDAIANILSNIEVNEEYEGLVIYCATHPTDSTQIVMSATQQASPSFVISAIMGFLLENPRIAMRVATELYNPEVAMKIMAAAITEREANDDNAA